MRKQKLVLNLLALLLGKYFCIVMGLASKLSSKNAEARLVLNFTCFTIRQVLLHRHGARRRWHGHRSRQILPGFYYSIYLLYYYKSTSTDAAAGKGSRVDSQEEKLRHRCSVYLFNSAKVQILTRILVQILTQ